jgi:hypothetical protein
MPHWELRKVPGGAQKALAASRNLCASVSVSRARLTFFFRARSRGCTQRACDIYVDALLSVGVEIFQRLRANA